MKSRHLRDLPDGNLRREMKMLEARYKDAFERTVPKRIPETSGMCKKSFQSLSFKQVILFSLLQLYSKAIQLYR